MRSQPRCKNHLMPARVVRSFLLTVRLCKPQNPASAGSPGGLPTLVYHQAFTPCSVQKMGMNWPLVDSELHPCSAPVSLANHPTFASRGVAAVEAHADNPVPGPLRRWGLCSLLCAC